MKICTLKRRVLGHIAQKKEEQRSAEEMRQIESRIKDAALIIFEHESRIIDMMWEKVTSLA